MTTMKTIIYPVGDLSQAKAVFSAVLGAEPVLDQPYYVQYVVDGVAVGLDPNGHEKKGMTGPVPYFHVSDIEATIKALVAAGATQNENPRDVGGGRLVGSVKDATGNVIGVIQDS
jgi:predicted enzyme related to lactoylglutathione lyase